jgi:hypothetical protein
MRTNSIVSKAAVCGAAMAAILVSAACSRSTAQQTYNTPEEAVRALVDASKAEDLDQVISIFGSDGRELADSSDQATARRNREVFIAAAAERWQLVDQQDGRKVLVIGNESWPFPVPLVKDQKGWRFDTEAGKEEVVARRVGRNELAAIRICRTFVDAQRIYAQRGHDNQPAGLYAKAFRSDQGRQNGLFWRAGRGEKRSPLGDLVAQAAEEGTDLAKSGAQPSPFHGYYFRILTAQGAAAPGGARDYIVDGKLSGGFALVAWPAQYDVTGVMTFVVNQDGVVREKDLGAGTDATVKSLKAYDPDSSWAASGDSPQ